MSIVSPIVAAKAGAATAGVDVDAHSSSIDSLATITESPSYRQAAVGRSVSPLSLINM